MRASTDQSSVAGAVAASTTVATTSTKNSAAERAIGREGLQDRARVGEAAAGFDQHPAEMRDTAAVLALGDETAQRKLQVGARGAAQAAVAE